MKKPILVLPWLLSLLWVISIRDAAAQGEDGLFEEDPPEARKADEPSGPGAGAGPGGEYRRRLVEFPGVSDHEQTIGAWGFQVTSLKTLAELAGEPIVALPNFPAAGVRRWNGGTGWEAGGTVAVLSDADPRMEPGDPMADRTTEILLGGSFGLLRSLGVHQHMVVFWEPEVRFWIRLPGGVDEIGDPLSLQYSLSTVVSVGTEIRLGILGLPRLGMTAKISGGLSIVDDGNGLNFALLGGAAENSGLTGLLGGAVGFVFYK